ncbi:MAG: nucleotidyltransferase [Verrucomicrobia bacterium]|nr:nucleotidyltransferase [Verrucomicrobiota bacterium]
MRLTLVILAAGMGSRYGGLKQLDAVGPSGETVLDYAVFDACRAGFTRVLFVIRRDFADQFRAQIGARYAGVLEVDYAFQAVTDLPDGRVPPADRARPWGTGHALWCARAQLDGPFAVINADDFYGRDSFVQLARFLAADPGAVAPGPARCAMVGFHLAKTLSEHGTVSRGVCELEGRRLTRVTEHTGIAVAEVGEGRRYSGEEVVSLNCWGFSPAVLPLLDRRLRVFLAERGSDVKAEFYLPEAISGMVSAGEATVDVLETTSSWFGVTYREDRAAVESALRALVAAGEYPDKLGSK